MQLCTLTTTLFMGIFTASVHLAKSALSELWCEKLTRCPRWGKPQLFIQKTLDFGVWKMWILWKLRFCKCEFCEKCEFENVNFVKIEIFKLRYLDKMWILGPLCCPWWELYLMTMRMMMMGEIWSLLSQALIQSKGQFFFSRQGIFFHEVWL